MCLSSENFRLKLAVGKTDNDTNVTNAVYIVNILKNCFYCNIFQSSIFLTVSGFWDLQDFVQGPSINSFDLRYFDSISNVWYRLNS